MDVVCSCKGCELSELRSWSGGFDSWRVGIRTQYIVGGVKCYSAGVNRGVGRTERGKDGAIMKYFPETDPSHSLAAR